MRRRSSLLASALASSARQCWLDLQRSTWTAVWFLSEDEGVADAVAHASVLLLAGGVRLRVATPADLITLKLAAAAEPDRRASKREHDIADVLGLLEEYPELRAADLIARLQDIRRRLVAEGV